VDVVGEAGVGADAEILAVALDALRDLGLGKDDIVARVSDRRLLAALLRAAGIRDDVLLTAYEIVDKVEREDPSRTLERLQKECGLGRDQAERLLELIQGGTLDAIARAHGEDEVVAGALAELAEFRSTLEHLGLGEFVEVDIRIVRGLAYYTGIVFEIFDRERKFRAICGGGRYDRLLELVGGEPLPATGFGMGDVVLTELLADRGLLPGVDREADLFIVVIAPDLRPLALELATAFRTRGSRVLYALRDLSVKKQFSAASTEGARQVLVLGPDEVGRGVAVVRDMASGGEVEVPLGRLREGEGLAEHDR
jgi:histidyl-tRNA synthetase